ncbi:MAG TPA: ATP-binding cassette domain-containing protein, partial [Firmicutes bacterium]|nr:ATP-binding cassette domain-containing protein [Bacillota bacterium]
IFQDPYASLNPRQTVEQIVGLPLILHGTCPSQVRPKVKALLRRVGLHESSIDRFPHQFSGGQRQRIVIARALALKPRFIIADEAVSALDVSIQAQILNLLKELQREYQLTYLFITHNLSVVSYISDRIAVMYLGQIVETAETERLFATPLHPYTKALLSAIPRIDGQKRERIILTGSVPTPINPPSGCRFYPRCYLPEKSTRCLTVPQLWEVEDGHYVACHYAVSSSPLLERGVG